MRSRRSRKECKGPGTVFEFLRLYSVITACIVLVLALRCFAFRSVGDRGRRLRLRSSVQGVLVIRGLFRAGASNFLALPGLSTRAVAISTVTAEET